MRIASGLPTGSVSKMPSTLLALSRTEAPISTARKAAVGDQIIIFCYEYYSDEEIKRHKPKIIQVDGKNRITRKAVKR